MEAAGDVRRIEGRLRRRMRWSLWACRRKEEGDRSDPFLGGHSGRSCSSRAFCRDWGGRPLRIRWLRLEWRGGVGGRAFSDFFSAFFTDSKERYQVGVSVCIYI